MFFLQNKLENKKCKNFVKHLGQNISMIERENVSVWKCKKLKTTLTNTQLVKLGCRIPSYVPYVVPIHALGLTCCFFIKLSI